MNIKYILIVLGEPYSTFSEIIGKYFAKKIIKNKIILIGNKNLLLRQLRKLNYDFKLNEINKINEARRDIVNIINIEFKFKKYLIVLQKSQTVILKKVLIQR